MAGNALKHLAVVWIALWLLTNQISLGLAYEYIRCPWCGVGIETTQIGSQCPHCQHSFAGLKIVRQETPAQRAEREKWEREEAERLQLNREHSAERQRQFREDMKEHAGQFLGPVLVWTILVSSPILVFAIVWWRLTQGPDGLLFLAKWALSHDGRGLARERLKKIVDKYPASNAASTARDLLDKHFPRRSIASPY